MHLLALHAKLILVCTCDINRRLPRAPTHAAAGVANIKHYNGFFKDAGCQVYLCTPNIDTDLTYRAYLDNNLIDGVIICPEMYEDNGSEMIAKAVKEAGVEFDGMGIFKQMQFPSRPRPPLPLHLSRKVHIRRGINARLQLRRAHVSVTLQLTSTY